MQVREAMPTSPAPVSARADSALRMGRLTRVLLYLVAIVLSILWVVPSLWILLVSFKPQGSNVLNVASWFQAPYSVGNYVYAFTHAPILLWLLNSFLVALIVTVLVLLLSVLCAFPISQNRFPGRGLVVFLLALGLMVPGEALLIPFYLLFRSLHMLDGYGALILPSIAVPFGVLLVKQFFDGLSREYFEAARMDGCGVLRMIFMIAVPLARPALAALAIFTFLGSWNNFLWPYISITSPNVMTVPVGIPFFNSSYHTDYTLPATADVIVSIPVFIVYVLFQRHIIRGFAFSGLK
ncbi:carbohydrate ABC transporter permease [Alicyclobacillus kakegawensis]|uniref:carbohydrate ABC transporter permease n=1 Tax=Alicyclobacillus kakegawensis TaxID=392012 RepID=UPI0009F9A0C2|nr:carbohydrate ABC transporter permease [Alicyclobacillus kakegawensis]